MTLLRAVLQIWGLIGGVFAAFGILAFTRRELATAQGKG
jgi:LPS O-antigen subunit length determinant protein (WzzB/FepE family)